MNVFQDIMNRNAKWMKPGPRETRRPRRECYQLLDTSGDVDGDDLLPARPHHYLEKVLEPGDTLQTLSLQFNCPVSELKRVNNILRENEIFARRVIKVPVKPGSVLSEKLAQVHTNGNGDVNKTEQILPQNEAEISASVYTLRKESAANIYIETRRESPIASSSRLINIDTFDISQNTKKQTSLCEASSALYSEDRIANIKDACGGSLGDSDSDISELSNNSSPNFKSATTGWGLSWLHIAVCFLIFGCVGPIVYLLHVAEKKQLSEVRHNHTNA